MHSLIVIGVAVYSSTAFAVEFGTLQEAKQLAEKAEAIYKEKGLDALRDMVSYKDFRVVDKDLYVFVGRDDGFSLAHGFMRTLEGKNFRNLKDVQGKFFVREIIDIAASPEGRGWVHYKWLHPKLKKVLNKSTYVVALTKTVFVAVGAYHPDK